MQSDATTQRIRNLLASSQRAQLNVSHAQTLHHILMQSGRMCVFIAGDSHDKHIEPYIMEPLTMEERNTNSQLEALFQTCPVPFESEARMRLLASKATSFGFCVCLDRSITNITSLTYLFDLIERTCPANVYAHWEPCNSHGVALTKGKHNIGKKSAAALCSFTRYIRDGRSASSLYDGTCPTPSLKVRALN